MGTKNGKLSKSRLQAALDSLTAANNRAREARDRINAHCMALYGVDPADVDNDLFIDSVDGGCGASSGMWADAFDESMRAAMERAGIGMPEQED